MKTYIILLICTIIYLSGCIKETPRDPIIFTNKEGFKKGDVICLSDSVYGMFILADARNYHFNIIGIVQNDSSILVCKSFQVAVNRHIKIHDDKLNKGK